MPFLSLRNFRGISEALIERYFIKTITIFKSKDSFKSNA